MNDGCVLVTGGAGYVGSVLVPKLLARGHRVKVLDLYLYGTHVLDAVKSDPRLVQIRGDIRDHVLLEREMRGIDTVIHLACISNDPSFELNPELGRSINYDAFPPLVEIAKRSGVKRFVLASTSSVYGVKSEENVVEELPLEPLTDYSKYKALCERVLIKEQSPRFTTVIIRPATVCGYSPRMRLDLSVNILTNHAVNRGVITVFGGDQKRPNIHIEDITDLYVMLLAAPDARIAGKTFNAGYENRTIMELAGMVRRIVGEERVTIETRPTNDPRSYHISSEKIRRELGFAPRLTVEDAVRGMVEAHRSGKLPDPMQNVLYYNIRTMKAAKLA
ncbi:MAG: SDR family oxidoreductase [Candidatus Aureabacteria bacterium]|nr:SDR family oxidoreductase [Candidatus Auribacterota bacterium]